ncbi:MAG: hypothetical protein AAF492_22675 [Verrucomicrobiota bacterium]
MPEPSSPESSGIYLGKTVSDFAPTPDLKNLQAALDRLVGLVGGLTLPDKEVRVLDLACGVCEEAFTISSWLSNLDAPLEPRRVEFRGYDIRDQDLVKARNRCEAAVKWFEQQKWSPPWLDFDFRKIDASKPLPEGLLATPQDVVFVRHQNTWHGAAIWTRIFENAFNAMTENGYLIITSYFDKEHQQAMELIRGLGGRILATLENPRSRPMRTKDKSVDRHVAIFANRETTFG